MVTLQKILDAEFELEKESIIKHQREKREQAAKQAGLQRKRMMLERQLREEISEIEKDHRIEFWLTLVSFTYCSVRNTDGRDACCYRVVQFVNNPGNPLADRYNESSNHGWTGCLLLPGGSVGKQSWKPSSGR